jgi:hypothetical protein
MSRPQEVNKLLNKLTNNVGNGPAQSSAPFEHYLMPELDVTAYKSARAWPGKAFVLLGNSFCVEAKVATKKALTKRKASLAIMFQQARDQRQCISIGDALNNECFTEILSRFERDWLCRMHAETMIGPAYDMKGNLIGEAFAVWKSVATISRNREAKLLAGVK